MTPRPGPRADPPTPPYGRTERRSDPRRARRGVPGPGAATRGGTVQRRLVGLARVLAGGLVVLTLAVVAGPWLLDGPGAGGAAVAWHVVGAAVAVGATAVAAHPRTPPTLGVLAALAVPVDVLVVLGTYWWA